MNSYSLNHIKQRGRCFFDRSRRYLNTLTILSLTLLLILLTILHWLVSWNQINLHSNVFGDWRTNEASIHCRISEARYYDGPYSISTALSSFPRSGNSWVRSLIEKSTGFLTSSLYCDKKLRKTFRSECNKTNRFVVKTHFPVNSIRHFPDPQTHFRCFDRVIHVVRNPFDAIVSYHHFHKTTNHEAKLDPQKFRISQDKIEWYVRKYRSHYLYWFHAPIKRLLVRYEDLKTDTLTELRRVNHFLLDDPKAQSYLLSQNELQTTEWINDEKIQCAVLNTENPYRSNAQYRNNLFGIEWLGEDHVRYIIQQLEPIICQLGYHELFPIWMIERMDKNLPVIPVDIQNYLVKFNCSERETLVDFTTNITDTLKAIRNDD